MRTLKISLLVFILSITISAQNFWQQTNGPYCGDVYAFTISDSGYIYIGTRRGGLFKSTNDGEFWTAINEGIENLQGETIYSVSIDINYTMYVATRYNQVYRSTDYGETWIRKSNGLPSTLHLDNTNK